MVEMAEEFRIPVNARVRLRDGIDPQFYGNYSVTGNEGWIRNRKLDEFGFPKVLIQWDRDHWAENGQPDGWTWEEHFDIVESEQMPEKNDNDLATALSAFLANWQENQEDQDRDTKPKTEEPAKPDNQDDTRDEALEKASALLSRATSFVLVTVEEDEANVTPQAIQYCGTARDVPFLHLQLASMGLRGHEALALDKIRQIVADEAS